MLQRCSKFCTELSSRLDLSEQCLSLTFDVAKIEPHTVQTKFLQVINSIYQDLTSATAKLNDKSQSHVDEIHFIELKASK